MTARRPPYMAERAPQGRPGLVRVPARVVKREVREAVDEMERAEEAHVDPVDDADASDALERLHRER